MADALQAFCLLWLFHAACLTQAMVIKKHTTDSCECLRWQEAFQSQGADCTALGDETCGKFFVNLPNEKFCLNENFGQAEPRQWCYVSSSCASGDALTWGTSSAAKFKWCGEQEETLGDKSPLELKEWTTKHDLEIGLAIHFAYPTWQGEKLTTDVLEFFGLSRPKHAPVYEFYSKPLSSNPELRQRLQARADAGKPTLIVSTAGHPPFGIMKGKELYWLNFSDEQLEVMKQGGDFFQRKGKMNDLKCVAGCDQVVEPWMSPINKMIGMTPRALK